MVAARKRKSYNRGTRRFPYAVFEGNPNRKGHEEEKRRNKRSAVCSERSLGGREGGGERERERGKGGGREKQSEGRGREKSTDNSPTATGKTTKTNVSLVYNNHIPLLPHAIFESFSLPPPPP